MSNQSALRDSIEELSELRKGEPENVPSLLRLLDAVYAQAMTAEQPGAAQSARILGESIECAVRNGSAPHRIGAIIDSALERLRRKCAAEAVLFDR